MSRRQATILRTIHGVVAEHFATMQNPRYQGPAWTWDDIENADLPSAQVFMCLRFELTDEEERFTEEEGRRHWVALLKQHRARPLPINTEMLHA